jgi:formylmethanofuran dehydrogenase subunit B
VKNACRRGASIFIKRNSGRAYPSVDGKEVELDKAIEKAAELIADSKNLVLYGMDTITIEAQKLAMEIAEKKQAFIDDCSSFCLGDFVEMVLKRQIPTTTLDEVRDNAYVIIYWGSNPFHSLPRHMSRYSYYPRGKKRQRGYEEDRFLVVIDVRRDHTSRLVKKNGVFMEVNSDLELIEAFMKVIEGKATDKFANEASRVLREMKKGESVIFGGLGLKYGLRKNYEKFIELMKKFNEVSRVHFIPSGFHSNMRGFNETLFERTGFVNRYSFAKEKSSEDFEFSKLLAKDVLDTALIIGSDPLNSLPFEIAKKLTKVNTIVIDPRRTFTAEIAKVVIPSAISGVESNGTMVRSDGIRIRLEAFFEKEVDDVYVLNELREMLC